MTTIRRGHIGSASTNIALLLPGDEKQPRTTHKMDLGTFRVCPVVDPAQIKVQSQPVPSVEIKDAE